MVNSYKDLQVWKKSMDLVTDIYQVTSGLPSEEKFGLISQIRRCAVSIPSNIAEGHARDSIKEYIHFLHISLGSVAELETQIIISKNLNYIDDSKKILSSCDEIGKMLRGLSKSLSSKIGNLKPINTSTQNLKPKT